MDQINKHIKASQSQKGDLLIPGERIKITNEALMLWGDSGCLIKVERYGSHVQVRLDSGPTIRVPHGSFAVEVPVCPDGGTCHHCCTGRGCFRVDCCEPLSGVYVDDKWPEGLRR
jgi:hypothetical protein